jgi:NADPH:quinone reductase-like Zn-dependent oxidoreductase
LVGAGAIQALEDAIKLKKGQKILILGGAGGIGSITTRRHSLKAKSGV